MEWQPWKSRPPVATLLHAACQVLITTCAGDLTPAVDISDYRETLITIPDVDPEIPLLEEETHHEGRGCWSRFAVTGWTTVTDCERLQPAPEDRAHASR